VSVALYRLEPSKTTALTIAEAPSTIHEITLLRKGNQSLHQS
jgi:hypothetical protein